MTSIQALRERLAALNKEAKNILAEGGTDNWNAENQKAFDDKMAEADRVQNKIEATQRLLDADAELNFSDVKPENVDKAKLTPQAAAIREGFEIFLRKKREDMTAEELVKVKNTMSTTTGSQGGFGVQTLVSKDLIDILKAYAYMRRVASSISTENGADLSYPTTDGTAETGELIAQNTTATSLDPSFGTRPLNTYKFGSKIVTVPIELIQDAQFDVAAMVKKRLMDRIGRIENTKFTIGAGTTEPFGLVTASGTGKVGLTGQTLTIIYDDLVDMVDSLDAAYLAHSNTGTDMPGAAPGWMFSQTLRRVLRKIKDTAGRPIWTPSYDGGAQVGMPDMLLDFPVYLNNDMPVPAANAFSLAFGNFQKYMIRDAMDITMFRFDDSAFMKLGQVGFLAWARAGGNLLDINSVKLYQHSAT